MKNKNLILATIILLSASACFSQDTSSVQSIKGANTKPGTANSLSNDSKSIPNNNTNPAIINSSSAPGTGTLNSNANLGTLNSNVNPNTGVTIPIGKSAPPTKAISTVPGGNVNPNTIPGQAGTSNTSTPVNGTSPAPAINVPQAVEKPKN